MHKIYISLSLILSLLAFAEEKGIEYSGVSVTVKVDNKVKKYLVKRNIPEECKTFSVNNQTIWSGNFAHKDVPEVCKSTYVHTKGKLLSMHLDEDIETYGELEVLYFLQEMQHNNQMLLIDSRKEKWFTYRTIPGAINMPFHYFEEKDDYEFHVEYALRHLGVHMLKEGGYDFSNAKTLVLFCNGPWCNQSPRMIFSLIKIGYPAEKLKWYRGGMQDWLSAGMTSTRP